MISREILTYKDAVYVFQNAEPVIMAEWDSLNDFVTPEQKAEEIMVWHTFKWVLKDTNGLPVAMFGLSRVTKTTFTAWCMIVQGSPRRVWGQIAKDAREIKGIFFSRGFAKRIQAFICTERFEPLKFAVKLGMSVDTVLHNYGKDKSFYLMGVL